MKEAVFQWDKPQSKIENDLGFNDPFNLAFAETSARYMNKHVPMLHGPLSQTYQTGVDKDGGYVKYIQPYSHRQYNGVGFNFTTDFHPLATDHWDKAMMIADGDRLAIETDRLRKRFCK